MNEQTRIALIEELKTLIVEALMLEDVTPDQIDPAAPLFSDGLGLDSIDGLELAIALNRKYGLEIEANDERNENTFSSVNALADFVSTERASK